MWFPHAHRRFAHLQRTGGAWGSVNSVLNSWGHDSTDRGGRKRISCSCQSRLLVCGDGVLLFRTHCWKKAAAISPYITVVHFQAFKKQSKFEIMPDIDPKTRQETVEPATLTRKKSRDSQPPVGDINTPPWKKKISRHDMNRSNPIIYPTRRHVALPNARVFDGYSLRSPFHFHHLTHFTRAFRR